MTREQRDSQPISYRTSLPPGRCPVMTGFFLAQGCTIADEGCLLTRMPFDPQSSPIPQRACVAANWARAMVDGILRRFVLDSIARMVREPPTIIDGTSALDVVDWLRKALAEANVVVLTRAIHGGRTYEDAIVAATVVEHAIDAAVLAERVWSLGDDVERVHAAEDLGHAIGKVALHVNEVTQLEFLDMMRNL